MTEDPDRPTDKDRVHALQHDYLDLIHAVQTGCEYGVAGMHGDPRHASQDQWAIQKRLRVGVNSAIISQGALVKLLVAKGVITELEYWESIVAEFRDAVAGYEAELGKKFGSQVRLR